MRSKIKLALAIFALPFLAGSTTAGDGQSVEDLVRQAEVRAATTRDALIGFDDASVDKRVAQYRAEAADLNRGNRARVRAGMGFLSQDLRYDPFDDGTASDEGVIYIAVSLSMPASSLRALARDANKAGAVMVLQGLLDNSFTKTRTALKGVFVEGEEAGIAIDPRVFQQFHIDRVPAVISAPATVQPCEDGLDCSRTQVPFDIVRGNISLSRSLELLADRGDAAPDVAWRALKRMGN